MSAGCCGSVWNENMNNNDEKLNTGVFQLNFANMGLPPEEPVCKAPAPKITPAQAIALFCTACIGTAGATAACPKTECPLWSHRPGKKRKKQ